ncbi:MAG TPA: membrane protein insertion efficiency factor YidD [Alphaproteobacteria bacterium]|nr:membrane protein insertion efficiency factor YidD [Alphaproteobacteria bacterium]
MRNAVIALLCGLIWLYRHSVSYFIGNQCRFLPTCSVYASEAIKTHGPVEGSALTFRRICRCHPFAKLGAGQGFDPVPPHVTKPR